MRRVVVLGAGRPLGGRVAEALARTPGVERVVGLEAAAKRIPRERPEVECLAWSPDPRAFAERLRKEAIDTVVDCALVEDRTGGSSRPSGADVIAAMCVGAAIGQTASPVRSWVVASSTACYPPSSYRPLLHREGERIGDFVSGPADSIAEAEDYARGVAERSPHLNVAILRLQELVGAGFHGPVASLLARDRIPVSPGYDPAVQMLHPDDATDAIVWAARAELAGVHNVTSSGLLRWSDVVRATGRPRAVAIPLGVRTARGMLEALGVGPIPFELHDLLRFGNAVDDAKLLRAGFRARRDQHDCLADGRLA